MALGVRIGCAQAPACTMKPAELPCTAACDTAVQPINYRLRGWSSMKFVSTPSEFLGQRVRICTVLVSSHVAEFGIPALILPFLQEFPLSLFR
jgi:hypothetical protein